MEYNLVSLYIDIAPTGNFPVSILITQLPTPVLIADRESIILSEMKARFHADPVPLSTSDHWAVQGEKDSTINYRCQDVGKEKCRNYVSNEFPV